VSIVAIIGLVLSISGTTYAAIAALRSAWEQTVKEHKTTVNKLAPELELVADRPIRDAFTKHHDRFKKSLRVWDHAQWWPMAIMGLASLLMTVDVMLLDWSQDESLFTSARHRWWCHLYKGALGLMIIADIWAVWSMKIAYSRICDATEELQNTSDTCVSKDTKNKTLGKNAGEQAGTALVKVEGPAGREQGIVAAEENHQMEAKGQPQQE